MAEEEDVMADDEHRAEIEAEAAKALRERFGRLGILSRAVVYNHPSGEEIARVVLDVADRVRDARGDDDDPTPAVTPEQVKRANEMARGGGTMRRRAPRSLGEFTPEQRERIERRAEEIAAQLEAEAARSPQGEGHDAGIEAATRAIYGLTLDSPIDPLLLNSARDGIDAYLSRVSPARDGSVAVEDVLAVLRKIGEMAGAKANGADARAMGLLARKALAEFSPASAGDRPLSE